MSIYVAKAKQHASLVNVLVRTFIKKFIYDVYFMAILVILNI